MASSLADAVTDATTRTKSKPIVLSFLRNLKQAEGKVPLTAFPRILDGSTVVLAGAGPSLDESLPVLREHRDRCVVICVQTALGALLNAGVTPDLCFTMESVDVSQHLEGYDGLVVASLNSHPRVFARAELFVPSYNSCLHRALHVTLENGALALGSRPYHLGPSATTGQLMLVQECLRGPATKTIMVGMDLSYPGLAVDSQPAYATGAGWCGTMVHLDAVDGSPVLVFEGREDRERIHEESGQAAISRTKGAVMVESLDPGAHGEWTSPDMAHQVIFFEEYGAKSGVVNCTPRGALLRGYERGDLAEHLTDPEARGQGPGRAALAECARSWTTQPGPVLADVRDQCEVAIHLAEALPSPPDWRSVLAGMPLVEQYVAPDMLDLRAGVEGDRLGTVRRMYAAIAQGARELLEVLDE